MEEIKISHSVVHGETVWSWRVKYELNMYGETTKSKDKNGDPFTEETFREKAEKKWVMIKKIIDKHRGE